MTNKVGSVTVEVRPTVTLESAVACVMMLNLFLAENEEYRLELAENDAHDGVEWHLTDEPLAPATGGIRETPIPLSNEDRERLASMPAMRKLFENMGARFE